MPSSAATMVTPGVTPGVSTGVSTGGTPSAGAQRGPLPRLPWRSVLAVAGPWWALLWLVGRTGWVRPWDADQRWWLGWVAAGVVVLAAALLSALASRARSLRAVSLPGLLVGLTSGTVAGLATVALHGTRWSFDALYSDSGFRTEAATRFADSPGLADYAYRGLLSYYPPALPWVEGRLADLLRVPGWAAMKPVALVLAALVPLLAFAAWRRVLPDLPAALVVVATTVTTADLVKPDEWLVLAVLLPWWLEAVRDLRRRGLARAPAWRHGAVLGLLLVVHSYYVAPFVLATVVAVVVDVLTRRPVRRWPLRPVRAVVVAAVALVAATPYWVPLALMHLADGHADAEQRRWSAPGFSVPPLPLPVDTAGVLGTVCVVWLVVRLVRHPGSPLAASLTVLLVTTYAFFLGGQLLAPLGVAVLPEKSDELLRAVLVVGGVLGLLDLHAWLRPRVRGVVPGMVVAVLAAVLAAGALDGYAGLWLTGRPVRAAQHMRYPDGSYPAGGLPGPRSARHPWSVSPLPTGPSTEEVERTWADLAGSPLSDRTVLVTSRADLLATTPVHPFVAWKNIYSNPYGQYDARLALLRRASRCATARCTWSLLRDNSFDRVDGLVLTPRTAGYGLTLTSDRFPDGWAFAPITFTRAQLAPPYFARRVVRGLAVVQVLGPPRR